MNIALAKSDTGREAQTVFAAARDRLPGVGKIAEFRRHAFEAFERSGLPHRRIEEWKYTDLRAMMRQVLPLAAVPNASAIERARAALSAHAIEGAAKLVLVDGVFSRELSDEAEAGVSVVSLGEALDNGRDDLLNASATDALILLNAALATDGVVVTVADEATPARPIQVIHIATAASASIVTRSHIRLGRAARMTLIETFASTDAARNYQAHDAVMLTVGDEAELSQLRVMADATDAVNITSAIVTVGAKAKLNFFNLTSGGALSRFQGFVTLAGQGSDLLVNGVNLLKDTQHGDTTLVVDHAAPHCTSRENFRAVVDHRGHSVFQGRIIVRPDAQKTDGKMMTRALLLSDDAEADNKPELEIFADDVSCGHGATSGALDDALLFYLRARGLSEKEAQALLIQAFVGEAIEGILDERLREIAMSAAQRWLETRS